MKFKSRLVWVLFFSLVFFINSGFTVVGHRGDPIKYTEVTIQAEDSSFNYGADFVELDLQLSMD